MGLLLGRISCGCFAIATVINAPLLADDVFWGYRYPYRITFPVSLALTVTGCIFALKAKLLVGPRIPAIRIGLVLNGLAILPLAFLTLIAFLLGTDPLP